MKPSTGAAVRLHRNAVRDRPESLSAFKWNACPPSPESAPLPGIDINRTGRRLAFVDESGVVGEATPEDIQQYLAHLRERGEVESRATIKLLCVSYREAWGGVDKGDGLGNSGVVVKQFWDFEPIDPSASQRVLPEDPRMLSLLKSPSGQGTGLPTKTSVDDS